MKGAEPQQVIAGFPEFWEQVYRKYPAFFQAAKELEPIQNRMFRLRVAEPLHKVLRRIAKSVSNSFGALITLALNGYGADAMRVVRSMFEFELTAAYLKRHPETLTDYLDFGWVPQHRLLMYMRQYAPQRLAAVAPGQVAETEKQFAAVAPRFRDKQRRLRRWARASVREMAEEAGLIDVYLTVYSWASAMHHADFQGLAVVSESQTVDVDVAPSELWVEVALVTGHASTLRVLKCYNEVAQLGLDREMEEAREAFVTAWKNQWSQAGPAPGSE